MSGVTYSKSPPRALWRQQILSIIHNGCQEKFVKFEVVQLYKYYTSIERKFKTVQLFNLQENENVLNVSKSSSSIWNNQDKNSSKLNFFKYTSVICQSKAKFKLKTFLFTEVSENVLNVSNLSSNSNKNSNV